MNASNNLPPGVSTHDLPECQPRPWRDGDALMQLADGDHLDKFIDSHKNEILEDFSDNFPHVSPRMKAKFLEWLEEEIEKNPVEPIAGE